MEKKASRRSKIKYPALDPSYNLKTRTELIDYDYVYKLSESEKDFLNSFTEEFINANFNHKGEKLHKQTKDSYDRNNARNRDIVTRLKACNKLEYLEDLKGIVFKEEYGRDLDGAKSSQDLTSNTFEDRDKSDNNTSKKRKRTKKS